MIALKIRAVDRFVFAQNKFVGYLLAVVEELNLKFGNVMGERAGVLIVTTAIVEMIFAELGLIVSWMVEPFHHIMRF